LFFLWARGPSCHPTDIVKHTPCIVYGKTVQSTFASNFAKHSTAKIFLLCILLIMAALWNRAGHYIFVMWFLLLSIFLSSYFTSPILSRRRLHVYHTSAHGVALVRI